MAKKTANRSHKDTVFKDMFGSAERKEYTLSLYNAINDADYRDTSLLMLNTLENVLYIGMKNDVSFLVGDELWIWEHQSTYNPNMPFRMLKYLARLYERLVDEREEDEYSQRLILLPTPKAVVFYIGERKCPDIEVMRLSDAYSGMGNADIEVVCYNINYGRNKKLKEKCEALEAYSLFVEGIRRRMKRGIPLTDAVSASLDECESSGILTTHFKERRAEVADIFMTEYDEAKVLERVGRASYRRGREETMAENLRALTAGGMTVETALEALRVPAFERGRYRELIAH